jgi:hypothetical protein
MPVLNYCNPGMFCSRDMRRPRDCVRREHRSNWLVLFSSPQSQDQVSAVWRATGPPLSRLPSANRATSPTTSRNALRTAEESPRRHITPISTVGDRPRIVLYTTPFRRKFRREAGTNATPIPLATRPTMVCMSQTSFCTALGLKPAWRQSPQVHRRAVHLEPNIEKHIAGSRNWYWTYRAQDYRMWALRSCRWSGGRCIQEKLERVTLVRGRVDLDARTSWRNSRVARHGR